MRVFRVIMPVQNIDAAATFYRALLRADGERVTSGRHYFDCDGVLLACWDPIADGDPAFPGPNPGHVYLSTSEPLETVRQRVIDAGAVLDQTRGGIARQPWGERSLYARDPWGNPFGVVESGTEYSRRWVRAAGPVWLTSGQPLPHDQWRQTSRGCWTSEASAAHRPA